MDSEVPYFRVLALFIALTIGFVMAILMAANASVADTPNSPATQPQQSINDRENLLIRAQDRPLDGV